MKSILFAFVWLIGLSVSEARISSGGYLFNLNTYYNQIKTETEPSGSSSELTETVHDVKLGMIGDNLYLGGIHTSRSNELVGQEPSKGSAYGVSIGYFFENGIYTMAHYLINANYDNYEEGSGYQIDIAYLAMVSQRFHVGVEISNRSIKYSKDQTNASLDSYTKSETFPMLTLGFMF